MTDIYLFPIHEASKISPDYCYEYFPKRFTKAQRFINESDRLLSIGVGYLIHNILKCSELDIIHNTNGKPYLTGDKYFNASHSGEYSLLGVSDTEIGVDIEKINNKHLSIIDTVFTDDEKDWIKYDPLNRFFCLWTIKESILKHNSCGMIDNLKSLDVMNLVRNQSIFYLGQKLYCRCFEYDKHAVSFCKSNPDCYYNTHLVTLFGETNISSTIINIC